MKEVSFRRFVAASGWYDLAVTAPFATPWTLKMMLPMLTDIHVRLGLAGEMPAHDVGIGLFANLLGSVVVVWSLVRVTSPDLRLGRFDALARFLFSAWMIYAVVHGFSLVLLAFLVPELAWGIVQSLPVRRTANR